MIQPTARPASSLVRRTCTLLAVAAVALAASGCGGSSDDATTTTFRVRIDNVGKAYPYVKSGAFTTPVGASAPAPIGPGGAYSFSFTAPRGARLSLATMFVPSNDFFYAPDEAGIALYDAGGAPVSGDVTAQIRLWDAGTEANQEPGLGADQVQRQSAPNTGAVDPNRNVRAAPDTFGNLPPVAGVLRVTITPGANSSFTVRIDNVSTATTLATSNGARQAVPLSPGAWVVHTAAGPLFTTGAPDRGKGLEAIAEDGAASALAASLAADTGITVPLSPGVWALHTANDPLYTFGQIDRNKGLERIAEDGDPTQLAASLQGQVGVVASAAFNTPVGAAAPAPIGPGGAYEFTVRASPGQRLSLATMFVPSNDLFFGPTGQGIALFQSNGAPFSGDATAALMLIDAGTEVNQEPGVGPDQVQRQSAANTGPSESRPIGLVSDGFSYPATSSVIRLTITPVP